MKTLTMLRREHYFYAVFVPAWVELDGREHRVTGKWRLDGDALSFEVEHGYWEYGRFFGKKWITNTKWYGEDAVKFVQEFDCKRAG